ncbi:MAG: hypothetical protein LBP29_00830, partial [Treponema sp.]|nr:hypothetical protein [Treponema sp.]
MIGLKPRTAGRGASLLWVDDFWKQAGAYIFCREDDGVLILPPNRVYKINKTGAALITFLKNGGKAAELAASAGEESRIALIGDFFRTLAAVYSGDESSGSDAGSPDVFGNVKQVPFDFGYT